MGKGMSNKDGAAKYGGLCQRILYQLGSGTKKPKDSLEKQSNIKWQKLGTGWNGEQSYF